MKSKTAHIISTTHWDREWYWTQEQFRIRLVELIDSLVQIFSTNPEYKFYMLDGQTIPLEDYLEIKPDQRSKIEKLVKNGKLLIGPWYILPDVFLVSGESLIRNLLYGFKTAKEYGCIMDVGYLPDSFSHIDQIPQILNGFNLKEYFFMRGMGKQFDKIGTEFWWEAPDGSKVFTTYLIEGYFNAGGLGFKNAFIDFKDLIPDKDVAIDSMEKMLDKLSKVYSSDQYLLFNGSDHTNPQKELPSLLKHLNEEFEDINFVHSTLKDYVKFRYIDEQKLPVYKGEFTGNIHHLIVRSVYSTRMYLKQMNFESQKLLEKYAEPISSISFFENLNDFSSNIYYTWKTLLKNHPHDSISGCSIDGVHNNMVDRYERINQIGEYIYRDCITKIGKNINTINKDGVPILIYNPSGWERNEVIRGKILIECDTLKNINRKHLVLSNSDGEIIPSEVLSISKKYVAKLNDWKYYNEFEIEFIGKVPSFGYSVLYLNNKLNDTKGSIKSSKNSIENEFYKIKINKNGSLNIYDKLNKIRYNSFNLFEDTEDDGDEYTYSFVEKSKTFKTDKSKAKISFVENKLLSTTVKITVDLLLPDKLDNLRQKRSTKLIKNQIITYVTLKSRSNRIDIRTEIENCSKDHRLRVLFPTKFNKCKIYADGHFNVIERKNDNFEKPKERNKYEYYSTQHQSEFCTISNNVFGVTIANKGLPEFELILKDSTIALTLLRCVGWLNKNNLMTRWRMAGPDIETPGAQCLGKNVFEYSIILHKNSWENSYKSAQNFCSPLRIDAISKQSGYLPEKLSFIQIDSKDLILTSIKISENKKGLIIRGYNIKKYPVNSLFKFYKKINECFIVNLLEEKYSDINFKNDQFNISVDKNKIFSIFIN